MGIQQSRVPNVREAGRLGGLTVFRTRGKAFFTEIGKLGQAEMRLKHPNMAREWGKLGGRPKKTTLNDMGK